MAIIGEIRQGSERNHSYPVLMCSKNETRVFLFHDNSTCTCLKDTYDEYEIGDRLYRLGVHEFQYFYGSITLKNVEE